MKNLYYVSVYSHRRNEYTRVLLTARDADAAAAEVREAFPRDRIESLRFVCETPDRVYLEL